MRISAWSSDVCSSDLVLALQCQQPAQRRDPAGLEPQGADVGFDRILAVAAVLAGLCKRHPDVSRFGQQRERVLVVRDFLVQQDKAVERFAQSQPRVHVARPRSDHLPPRSEENTSELQSLMSISESDFCLKKKKKNNTTQRYIKT